MEGKLLKINNIYTLMVNDKMIASNNEDFQIDYEIKKLSLKNCEAIANGYDLDELAEELTGQYATLNPKSFKRGVLYGFQKALEILGDKKFSEEQLNILIYNERYVGMKPKDVIQSLQQTEWDVEVEMECVMCCQNLIINGENSICCGDKKPKLDANSCLILKRK